jgi:hypothetical protein
MLPHEDCGACTPSPRKLNPDSVKTALAIPKTELTIIGVKLFGRRCYAISL